MGWKRQSRAPASTIAIRFSTRPLRAATSRAVAAPRSAISIGEPAGLRIECPYGVRQGREHEAVVGIVRHRGVGFDLDRILLEEVVAAALRGADDIVVPPEMLGEPHDGRNAG